MQRQVARKEGFCTSADRSKIAEIKRQQFYLVTARCLSDFVGGDLAFLDGSAGNEHMRTAIRKFASGHDADACIRARDQRHSTVECLSSFGFHD